MDTQLSGIEKFLGRSRVSMNLRGTDRADQIRISLTRHITIRSRGGNDHARVWSDRWDGTVSVYAGRGADEVTFGGFDKSTARGGRGDDVLRGVYGSDDQLYGGRGHDVAYGGPGTDTCRAEVTRGCERS